MERQYFFSNKDYAYLQRQRRTVVVPDEGGEPPLPPSVNRHFEEQKLGTIKKEHKMKIRVFNLLPSIFASMPKLASGSGSGSASGSANTCLQFKKFQFVT